MFTILWQLEELKQLCEEYHLLQVGLNVVLDLVRDSTVTVQQSNIPRRLTKARERLLAAVKALYKYKCQPATHVFLFMIAHE